MGVQGCLQFFVDIKKKKQHIGTKNNVKLDAIICEATQKKESPPYVYSGHLFEG